MDNTELAAIILVANVIIAFFVLYWCDRKIKELTNKK
jgi:hypothetical protein